MIIDNEANLSVDKCLRINLFQSGRKFGAVELKIFKRFCNPKKHHSTPYKTYKFACQLSHFHMGIAHPFAGDHLQREKSNCPGVKVLLDLQTGFVEGLRWKKTWVSREFL